MLIVILNNCSNVILKQKNIKYNESKEYFIYKTSYNPIPLRNINEDLVTKQNYTRFLDHLKENNFIYDFKNINEKDHRLSGNDIELVKLYSDINININQRNYFNALKKIDTLKKIYPDITLFHDYCCITVGDQF